MQLGDGSWPWFPGGRGNDYITLYITTGFGRLRHLGVDIDVSRRRQARSTGWTAGWTSSTSESSSWPEPEKYVPSSTDALYLYGRSFFLKDKPIAPQHKAAVDFFLGQARKYWLKTDCRQTQGHLAIALKRFDASNALTIQRRDDIMKSIKERSVSQRGDGHVLARHRAELVVVSRADRDPGADDRGVRRSHGRRRRRSRTAGSGCSSRSRRRTGRPPRPRPTPSTPCCCAARTSCRAKLWCK